MSLWEVVNPVVNSGDLNRGTSTSSPYMTVHATEDRLRRLRSGKHWSIRVSEEEKKPNKQTATFKEKLSRSLSSHRHSYVAEKALMQKEREGEKALKGERFEREMELNLGVFG